MRICRAAEGIVRLPEMEVILMMIHGVTAMCSALLLPWPVSA